MNADEVTQVLRKSINILFVSNPRGTSLGVCIGVAIDMLLGVFSPAIKTIELIDVSKIKTWHLMSLGVLGMNFPAYIKRNKVDDSIINAIEYIEEQKRKGVIAEWQSRQMYNNLHNKVLEKVMLDSESLDATKRVNTLTSEPESSDSD